jgi:hypothetical protein
LSFTCLKKIHKPYSTLIGLHDADFVKKIFFADRSEAASRPRPMDQFAIRLYRQILQPIHLLIAPFEINATISTETEQSARRL